MILVFPYYAQYRFFFADEKGNSMNEIGNLKPVPWTWEYRFHDSDISSDILFNPNQYLFFFSFILSSPSTPFFLYIIFILHFLFPFWFVPIFEGIIWLFKFDAQNMPVFVNLVLIWSSTRKRASNRKWEQPWNIHLKSTVKLNVITTLNKESKWKKKKLKQ